MEKNAWRKIGLIAVAGVVAFHIAACGSVSPKEDGNNEKEIEKVSSQGVERGRTGKGEKSVKDLSALMEKTLLDQKDNVKVPLNLPENTQLNIIEKERDTWWLDDKKDGRHELFAVTDYDQNGYLEILVLGDREGEAVLYEVDEDGKALHLREAPKCFSVSMDNPISVYFDAEDAGCGDTDDEKATGWGCWGQKSGSETKGMERYFMYIQREGLGKEALREDASEMKNRLASSWAGFMVFEPLDLSGWEDELSKKEREQIRGIAETLRNFGTSHDDFEYAVCDLDQDGSLEILVKHTSGSGIIRRFFKGYAVNEGGVAIPSKEVGNLDKFHGDEYIMWDDGQWTCYQEAESGGLYYVFSAQRDQDCDTFLAEKEYRMTWNGHNLEIRPLKKKEKEKSNRKGKTSLCWNGLGRPRSSDLQYECVLVSYLKWQEAWK